MIPLFTVNTVFNYSLLFFFYDMCVLWVLICVDFTHIRMILWIIIFYLIEQCPLECVSTNNEELTSKCFPQNVTISHTPCFHSVLEEKLSEECSRSGFCFLMSTCFHSLQTNRQIISSLCCLLSPPFITPLYLLLHGGAFHGVTEISHHVCNASDVCVMWCDL